MFLLTPIGLGLDAHAWKDWVSDRQAAARITQNAHLISGRYSLEPCGLSVTAKGIESNAWKLELNSPLGRAVSWESHDIQFVGWPSQRFVVASFTSGVDQVQTG
jgi:hypothetical protein